MHEFDSSFEIVLNKAMEVNMTVFQKNFWPLRKSNNSTDWWESLLVAFIVNHRWFSDLLTKGIDWRLKCSRRLTQVGWATQQVQVMNCERWLALTMVWHDWSANHEHHGEIFEVFGRVHAWSWLNSIGPIALEILRWPNTEWPFVYGHGRTS